MKAQHGPDKVMIDAEDAILGDAIADHDSHLLAIHLYEVPMDIPGHNIPDNAAPFR